MSKKNSIILNKVIWITILTTCFFLKACTVARVVPIQITRVSQTESYKQIFSFLDKFEESNNGSSSHEAQNRRMDYIFTELLGSRNWQNLKDLYGLGTMKEELLNKDIYLQGVLNIILYIYPTRHSVFLLEGFGRYFLVREKTKAILLSGDFYVPLKRHNIEELDNGYITVDVELFVTRVPNQITYLKETSLTYKIIIDTKMAEKGTYSIDYNRTHNVYLVKDKNFRDISKSEPIAEMTFLLTSENNRSKLIDLRGMEFLRNDYKK